MLRARPSPRSGRSQRQRQRGEDEGPDRGAARCECGAQRGCGGYGGCGQPSAPIGDRPKPSRPPSLGRGRPALSGGGGEGVGRGLGAGDDPPRPSPGCRGRSGGVPGVAPSAPLRTAPVLPGGGRCERRSARYRGPRRPSAREDRIRTCVCAGAGGGSPRAAGSCRAHPGPRRARRAPLPFCVFILRRSRCGGAEERLRPLHRGDPAAMTRLVREASGFVCGPEPVPCPSEAPTPPRSQSAGGERRRRRLRAQSVGARSLRCPPLPMP